MTAVWASPWPWRPSAGRRTRASRPGWPAGDHGAVRRGGQRALRGRCQRSVLVLPYLALARAAPRSPCSPRGSREECSDEHRDHRPDPAFRPEPGGRGVDLQAGPGVFGLLGPNGAGKTTLLRMMATVIPPTSGTLRLLDRDPGAYAPRREMRRRLGYLPQNLGYYPGFTVAEFVEYFALLKEMPPRRVPTAVAAAVERVDLGRQGQGQAADPVGRDAAPGRHRAGHSQRARTAAARRADGRTRPRAAG